MQTLTTTPRTSPHSPPAARVLLVEDAPDMREIAHEALELLGYQVVSVASAEAAQVELEGDASLDVLITDISLPGKSGLELARLCAEKHPDIRVVFASGYGEISEDLGVPRALNLPKPYDIGALQDVMAAIRRG